MKITQLNNNNIKEDDDKRNNIHINDEQKYEEIKTTKTIKTTKNIKKEKKCKKTKQNKNTFIFDYVQSIVDIKKLWNTIIGIYYQIVHCLIILLGIFLIIFDNNPYHLIVLLNITTLDGFANIHLYNCPLTMLENKYLKNSMTNDRHNFLKNSNISYECNHIYESQLETIINVWIICAIKICFLFIMQFFQKKIVNI